MSTQPWRYQVSPDFRARADAALRKSRANLLAVRMRCRNCWIDLRIIESGVELRGKQS